jgi:hypothetical protein
LSANLQRLVIYHSFHRLRGKDPLRQIEAVESFLDACASDCVEFDQSVSLWSEAALNQAGRSFSAGEHGQLMRRLEGLLGDPLPTNAELDSVFDHSDLDRDLHGSAADWAEAGVTWDVSKWGLREAARLLQPLATSRAGADAVLNITGTFAFALKDPVTGLRWPGQADPTIEPPAEDITAPHGQSRIEVSLGNSPAVWTTLSFPFAAKDPGLLPYLGFIQQHLPIKLSLKEPAWYLYSCDGGELRRRLAVRAMGGAAALGAAVGA